MGSVRRIVSFVIEKNEDMWGTHGEFFPLIFILKKLHNPSNKTIGFKNEPGTLNIFYVNLKKCLSSFPIGERSHSPTH